MVCGLFTSGLRCVPRRDNEIVSVAEDCDLLSDFGSGRSRNQHHGRTAVHLQFHFHRQPGSDCCVKCTVNSAQLVPRHNYLGGVFLSVPKHIPIPFDRNRRPRDKRHAGEHHDNYVKDDGSDKIPVVRVHSMCLTGDTFHSLKCDCNSQLHNALRYIDEYGKGAVVYLTDHEGRGIGLCNKIKAYKLQEQGQDTVEANISLGFKSDLRDYGTGAQILVDLGYTDFNLISNNPKKIKGLEGYGLHIKDLVKVPSEITEYNRRYMNTKKEKMHHYL